jgi:hypothetical protein
VEALREMERQDETQFTTKIGEQNEFGSQLFHSEKFSFPPVTCLMAYYAEIGRSCFLIM